MTRLNPSVARRKRAANVFIQGDPVAEGGPLTQSEENFAVAFVVCRNAPTAYCYAYDVRDSIAHHNLHSKASALLHTPHVWARIEDLRNEAASGAIIKARELIQDWAHVAGTDTNELVRVETQNCRHCWGEGRRYQWADEDEYMQAVAAWEAKDEAIRGAPPDPLGGFGYAVQRDPNPACLECRGAGVTVVKITSTDKLSPAARKLYKGARVGKNGQVEILMHDVAAARKNLAETLGITSGKDPSLAAPAPVVTPEDATPERASVAYLDMLAG